MIKHAIFNKLRSSVQGAVSSAYNTGKNLANQANKTVGDVAEAVAPKTTKQVKDVAGRVSSAAQELADSKTTTDRAQELYNKATTGQKALVGGAGLLGAAALGGGGYAAGRYRGGRNKEASPTHYEQSKLYNDYQKNDLKIKEDTHGASVGKLVGELAGAGGGYALGKRMGVLTSLGGDVGGLIGAKGGSGGKLVGAIGGAIGGRAVGRRIGSYADPLIGAALGTTAGHLLGKRMGETVDLARGGTLVHSAPKQSYREYFFGKKTDKKKA